MRRASKSWHGEDGECSILLVLAVYGQPGPGASSSRLQLAARQPGFQFRQSFAAMRDTVLRAGQHTTKESSSTSQEIGRGTFSALSISAYVWPSYSKTASQPDHTRVSAQLSLAPDICARKPPPQKDKRNGIPKIPGPLAGTILPCVRPWKRIGSWSGPAQYANVHTAKAVLSSYAASMLLRPW